MPSFALYFISLVCSPLYFAIRKKWGAFTLNLLLYASALVLVFVFFVGVVPWAIGVAHAFWYIRDELMQRQAALIAEHMKASAQ